MWFLLPSDAHAFPLTSWTYTIPYFLLCFFIIFFSKNFNIRNAIDSENFNKKAYFFIFAVLTVFFGIRWYTLSDNIVYADEYNSIAPIFRWSYIEIHSWWWEKGYVIFAMCCKLITPDFHFFVFINTLIDFILLHQIIKRYSLNIPFTILLFLGFYGILMEINMMRNMKAILLFLLSIKHIEERNFIKFLLYNVIGFSMHSSAILFFPMYWLLRIELNKKFIATIAFVSTFIYVANIDITNGLINTILQALKQYDFSMIIKASAYYEQSETQALSLGTIERIITLVLALYAYFKQKKVNKQFIIFFNSYLIFFLAYSVFGNNEVFRDRFTTLFYYSYWFLYPHLAQFYKGKIKYFSLWITIYAMLRIFMLTHNCAAYFETVFFHNTTVAERAMLDAKTSKTW